MSKMYVKAGTAVFGKAGLVFRVASNDARVRALHKQGHTEIRLVDLPEAMSKQAAAVWLLTHADYQQPETQTVLRGWAEVEQPVETVQPETVAQQTVETVQPETVAQQTVEEHTMHIVYTQTETETVAA